jgi:hypothetical protein
MFGQVFKVTRNPHPVGTAAAVRFNPYHGAETNDSYHALFCDDARFYSPRIGERFMSWHAVLCNNNSSPAAVRAVAIDPRAPSTARALAWHWLRRRSHGVPPDQLNGLVVETSHARGLDTLAVYADGSVRYFEPGGTVVCMQAQDTQLQFAAMRAAAVAQTMLRTLPRASGRLAAPVPQGNVRLSFVASDGVHVDEGPLSLMVHERLAGRVLEQVDDLRQLVRAAPRHLRVGRLVDVVLPHAA